MLEEGGNSSLTVSDGNAMPAVALGHNDQNQRFVTLFDAQGRKRAVIQVQPDGGTILAVLDAAGNVTNHLV